MTFFGGNQAFSGKKSVKVEHFSGEIMCKSLVPVYMSTLRKDKTMGLHVNMSTSCRHFNISPWLWWQLVTENGRR